MVFFNNASKISFIIILLVFTCCNNKIKSMNSNSIEPFEVKVTFWNGRPSSPHYTLNEKELIGQSSKYNEKKSNWEEYAFFEKKLTPTEELINISKISIDKYEALQNETALLKGGNDIYIEFKKNGKMKQIRYFNFYKIKKYDDYTTLILNFINTQIPESIRIPT